MTAVNGLVSGMISQGGHSTQLSHPSGSGYSQASHLVFPEVIHVR